MLTPVSSAQATTFAFNFIQFLSTPMIYAPPGEMAWPTIWTSVRDHKELYYAFNTWDKPSLRYVNLDDLDFTQGQSLKAQVVDNSDEGDVAGNFYAVEIGADLFFLDKPLSINPTYVAPGVPFSYTLHLLKDIKKAFDFYVFAATPIGFYSIDFDGVLRDGIVPILKNVLGAKAPIAVMVDPQVILPPEASGQPITFYTVAVEAGKIPPIGSIDELDGSDANVIYMDKEPMTVK